MATVCPDTGPLSNGALPREQPGVSSAVPDHDVPWPDIDVRAARPTDPLIPDGLYDAKCVRCERVSMRFGSDRSERLMMHLEIFGGTHDGAHLRFVIPLPQGSRGAAPSSKLFRAWVVAAGRQPERRERMSLVVFRHKIFKVRVRTVTRGARQEPLPPANRYSLVDQLVERIA
jgi:hypothetical protein